MLTIEELNCLDLPVWLGNQQEAGQVLNVTQSKVSRHNTTCHHIFKALGLRVAEHNCGYCGDEHGLLVDLRYIHQLNRFMLGAGLRIQATCWTRELLLEPLPPGWVANQAAPHRFNDCQTQLLLHNHVIDAALVTAPEAPAPDDPVLCGLVLYEEPLILAVDKNHALANERGLSAGEIATESEFAHFTYSSSATRGCAEHLDQHLMGSPPSRWTSLRREPPKHVRRFSTCTTGLLRPDLVPLDFAIPYTSADVLVVRHEWADHPAITALISALKPALVQLQRKVPDLELRI